MAWLLELLEEESGERAAGWWGRKSEQGHLRRSGPRPRLGFDIAFAAIPLQLVSGNRTHDLWHHSARENNRGRGR